jgi:adenylate cyclase
MREGAMSRLQKGISLGIATGVLGLCVTLTPFGISFEEDVGLGSLFRVRGEIAPPPDVAIVSIDQESARRLNLPSDPWKWPRSFHARLLENLVQCGALVIAFDLTFYEHRSSHDDNLFAEAIRKAGNVVISEFLTQEILPLPGKGVSSHGTIHVERTSQPIPLLADAAVASAPFPLPKVPVKVGQYWAFKKMAGIRPTLPIVVFHLFAARKTGNEFLRFLKTAAFSRDGEIEKGLGDTAFSKSVEADIQRLRRLFESEPGIGRRALEELERENLTPFSNREAVRILRSLVGMYESSDSPYLNFYGPPGTIPSIPYYRILNLEAESAAGRRPDLRGKAVFVGLVDRYRPDLKDAFHTVFTQESGIDIAGVEIAATAFGNLLENRPVRPLAPWRHAGLILLWGVGIGMLSFLLPTFLSAGMVLGLSALYACAVFYEFNTAVVWNPVAIPILFQAVPAFVAATVWRSADLSRERLEIRKAFEYYLPNDLVDQLLRNIADFKVRSDVVYAICLYTDAEGYTALSERMDPKSLGRHMEAYYGVIFEPIRRHGGLVSNIVADATLALWVSEKPDAILKTKACQAAVEIARNVETFNRTAGDRRLPVRISLHAGSVLLGSVGAADHFEYRPTGDIINAATRIGGLNKLLKAQILVSQEAIDGAEGFVTRRLGRFLLKGKRTPLAVFELICAVEGAGEEQGCLRCESFAAALDAFERQSWDEAAEAWQRIVQSGQGGAEDGPSRFYLNLCERYRRDPPDRPWDAVVHAEN